MDECIIYLFIKGSLYAPSNYRGISIASNLGKLFNKVTYNRIMKFVNEHGLICENQIGFKADPRTLYHMLTLWVFSILKEEQWRLVIMNNR